MRLVLDNSYSRIEGLTDTQLKELRALCAYKPDPKANYFSGRFSGVQYLCSKKGEFPSGLLPRVMPWFNKYPSAEVIHARTRPAPCHGLFTMTLPVTPYKAQVDAVKACKGVYRGTVCMPTGSGKSVVISMLINALQVKTLVIVPTLTLKEQLTESFRQYFGDTGGNIVVENIGSSKLKHLTDFDLLIIDECHMAGAKSYRTLNKKCWGKIFYRFSFSATPYRNRDEEQILMESITSDVIYRMSYAQAIETKAIVPVEAYYLQMPKSLTSAVTWAEVYSELVVNNTHRNNTLIQLLLTLHNGGMSTLCLVKEVAHGEILTANGAFPFANGQDEHSETLIQQFNTGAIKTLIGTTGILGMGVDTKPCEFVIIAGLGKSKPQFLQQVGRSVRRHKDKVSAKVILIKDPSHKFTARHYATQCVILKEELGIKPVLLEL